MFKNKIDMIPKTGGVYLDTQVGLSITQTASLYLPSRKLILYGNLVK